MKEDLYSILGIASTATAGEIKKAYIKLAREKHPDVLKNSLSAGDKREGEEFKKIAHAYDILRDVRKRREYDVLRKSGGNTSGGFATSEETRTRTRTWRQNNNRGGGGKGDAYEGASWEDSRFTEQELKNRYAKFKSESKSRAENSKWWREEKKEAEKNKKEFNEKAFQARARKAGRDAERLKRSGGFVARTGYVWQDAMVGMVSVAICIGAGTYINRKMEQRAREKHHEEYSMTNAPPVPQKNDGDGGNDDVQNK